MESEESLPVLVKKTNIAPKAIIRQKFGTQACYTVEEVNGNSQNDFPGLALPQNGPCLYQCRLELPEFCVMSEICTKKKNAEISAAEKALKMLEVQNEANISVSMEDPWNDIVSRLSYFFSDEFLSAPHPLSGHFRASLKRSGDLNGLIPISAIIFTDSKLKSLCKSIDPMAESNSLLAISLTTKAAARLPKGLVISENLFSLRRQNPYPHEVLESLDKDQVILPESICIKSLLIPHILEKIVEPISIIVATNGYYLDAIAQMLHLTDASMVQASKILGKASSEIRLYFCDRVSSSSDLSSDKLHAIGSVNFEESFNVRASYFSGQNIYGNAILASIGYTRRSKDLYHEDVSLHMYYRMLLSKQPRGLYKLSREATLVADLPVSFTSQSNWRGSAPADLLRMFCIQHRLADPIFSPAKSCQISKDENGESECSFRCDVKILSKSQELVIGYFSQESHKKQRDSIQNAALKVLTWLNIFFKEPNMHLKALITSGDSFHIKFNAQCFLKQFALYLSMHSVLRQEILTQETILLDLKIDGPDCGLSPTNGSLVCISYSVSLILKGDDTQELLEINENFEFEMGIGAVISHIEFGVTQMFVGQSARFITGLPSSEIIFYAVSDSPKVMSLLSLKHYCLEYTINLLKVTEPLEDRLEQAFFSPPLSKQRVEYAVQHIKESTATTLIDFGCGSGSLLSSLLEYSTDLEKIVGIDISQKSLFRAAKILHSKLSGNLGAGLSSESLKSVLLYEGSITDLDSRLCGFDIGTCLEVIEHMEEDQAHIFGEVVLTFFCPRVLIVSTPNYEYNAILNGSSLTNREEDHDKKNQFHFRNHDHKFEWTRAQFNRWAIDLAKKHSYVVEFSGVGGFADVEPGFASQIAVFVSQKDDNHAKEIKVEVPYKILWEWNKPILT